MQRKIPITLKDVACHAGCSIAAASKVLNCSLGNIGVSKALTKKIQAAAQQLGYHVNYHAQSLQRQRARTVGLMISPESTENVHTGYWGEFVQGLDTRLRVGGNDLLIIGPSDGEDELRRSVRYMRQRRIDALVLPGVNYHDCQDVIGEMDAPIVVPIFSGESRYPRIQPDDEPGIRMAVDHLWSLGHRRLLWAGLQLPDGEVRETERYEIFRRIVDGRDMETTQVFIQPGMIFSHARPAAYISAVRDWFEPYFRKCNSRPTAVFAYNDLTAIGIIAALRRIGLSVPGDVSVVGYDDIEASLADPALTTISLNLAKLGETTGEVALGMADAGGLAHPFINAVLTVPTSMVVRDSTGAARQKS